MNVDTSKPDGTVPGARWTLVVVVDGDPPVPGWGGLIARSATVIAADGGARHAEREGVPVTDLIGDLDTLTGDEVEAAARSGATVHRYDPAKNFTDFELAASLAAAKGRSDPAEGRLLVVGGAGGRLDHALGNIAVLGGPELSAFEVTALVGDAVVSVVTERHPLVIWGTVGDVVSLVPVGGPAQEVTTSGLAYPLFGEDLAATATRGISNVLADRRATVSIGTGSLLVIRPGAVRGIQEVP